MIKKSPQYKLYLNIFLSIIVYSGVTDVLATSVHHEQEVKRTDEFLVPANGHCLYTSVILSSLLPLVDKKDTFQQAVEELTGGKGKLSPQELLDSVNRIDKLAGDDFNHFLSLFLAHVGIKLGTWGGPKEMQTIADKLRLSIQEYTPDPDDLHRLVIQDKIEPKTDMIIFPTPLLHIVRDNPLRKEIIRVPNESDVDKIKEISVQESKSRQHYRCRMPRISPKKFDKLPSKVSSKPLPKEKVRQPNPSPPQEEKRFTSLKTTYKHKVKTHLESALKKKWQHSSHDQGKATSKNPKLNALLVRWNGLLNIPPCIERNIKELMCILDIQLFVNEKNFNTKDLETSTLPYGQPWSDLDKLTQQTYKSIAQAVSLHENRVDLEVSLKQVAQNISTKAFVKANSALKALFRKVEPFHIEEAIELIQKSMEASTRIKDQEVILFVGGTGAGKSTTILWLAGCKMEKQKIDNLDHIGPVEVQDDNLKKITTSPHFVSETRYIASASVKVREKTYMLCDTPGFEDTGGPEIDVANGAGMIKAIHQAKSIRCVVLIPYPAFNVNRGQAIKNMVNTLIQFLPSFSDYEDSFAYFFTRVPKNKELDQVASMFLDMKENLTPEEQNNQAYVDVFGHIAETIGDEKVDIIDPLQKVPKKLLKDLADLKAIKYPEEKFKSYVTSSSREALNVQLEKHKQAILHCAQSGNDLLAAYKLHQLRNLAQWLAHPPVQRAYDAALKGFKACWEQRFGEYRSALDDFFDIKKHRDMKDTEKGKAIASFFTKMAHFEKTRKTSFPRWSGINDLMDHFSHLLGIHIATLLGTPLQGVDPTKLQFLIDRLLCLDKVFDSLAPLTLEIKKEYAKEIQHKIDDLGTSFKNKALQEVTEEQVKVFCHRMQTLSSLSFLDSFLEDHIKINKALTDLQHRFLKRVTSFVDDEVLLLFSEEHNNQKKQKILNPLKDKELQCIIIAHHVVSTCLSTFNNYKILTSLHDTLAKKLDTMNESLLRYVKKVKKSMFLMFKQKGHKGFSFMGAHMQAIEQIIDKIDTKQHAIDKLYHEIKSNLLQYMSDVRRDIQEMVSKVISGDQNISYKRLVECIGTLVHSNFTTDEDRDHLIAPIKEQLEFHTENLKNKIDTLDVTEHNHLESAFDILKCFAEIKRIEKLIPGLDKRRLYVERKVKEDIHHKLNSIHRKYNLQSQSVTNKEKVLQHLKALLKEVGEEKSLEKYLVAHNVQGEKDWDMAISMCQSTLKKIKKTIKKAKKTFEKEIETVNKKTVKMKKMHLAYQSELLFSTSQANNFLKEHDITSIEDLKGRIHQLEKKRTQQKKQFESLKTEQEAKYNHVKKELKKHQEAKKQYTQRKNKNNIAIKINLDALLKLNLAPKKVNKMRQNEGFLKEEIHTLSLQIESIKKENKTISFPKVDPADISRNIAYMSICRKYQYLLSSLF